jgi:FemAB-related protein (PEP-CTERM system-associated)
MKVVHCPPGQAAAWDDYVARSDHGSFYHRYAWKRINEEYFGHRAAFLAALDGDRFAGLLPIVQVKSRLFGNIACSMPFVNYGGPCADDADVERILMEEAGKVVDGWGSDYLEIRSRQPLETDLPASSHKVSLTVALDPDPEVLFKGFKTGHRQEIRRAYKHGLTAKFGSADLLDPFYEVLSESWHTLGSPFYAKEYFKAILDAFPDSVRICVVYMGDEPVGAAFDGLEGDTVEGMWLGIKSEYRKLLVGYALYWELIKNACERGFTSFHLGRSTADSNAEAFKKKWNATVTQLHWSYLLRSRREIPQLNVTNPRFQMAIAVWRRLPLSVTNVVGPMIARSIP